MFREKIDDVLEGHVLWQKYSHPQTVKIVKNDGISTFQKTVSNVKRKIGLPRNSGKKIKSFRSRLVATQSLISKVIKQINIETPRTHRSVAKSCHDSQSTISRIIKRSNFVLRKK